jgi:hypothetical protein
LNSYSFNSSVFGSFLTSIFQQQNIIHWSTTYGTFKSRIIVACNCTEDQINSLNTWFNKVKLNGREIEFVYLPSILENINEPSDVLLIWGYRDINSSYYSLKNYLNKENGIVEIMNFTDGSVFGPDSVQNDMFGLEWWGTGGAPSYDYFNGKPIDSNDIRYGPFKLFYHVPYPLRTITSEIIGDPNCYSTGSEKGNITFNSIAYRFWICNSTTVWFDTDGVDIPNSAINVGGSFTLGGYNFSLRYINDNSSIGVSFRSDFKFNDFLASGLTSFHVEPLYSDTQRVLLYANSPNWPVVILNRTSLSNVAWMADFSAKQGDDNRHLLLSLLLWASNKKTQSMALPSIKSGLTTSYTNVLGNDMFEVYEFDLGLGHPF